ncbi:MAG: hypothetical protein AB2806_08845 [Candidatus Thiodiazotropha sp.]
MQRTPFFIMQEYIILKTFRGSPNGYEVNEYVKDETVPLVESLANEALKAGWIRPVDQPTGKSKRVNRKNIRRNTAT